MPRKQRSQPVRLPPSPVYGAGVASAAAQQALPLPQADVLPPAGTPAAPAAPRVLPPGLGDPTRRPNEPVTAGINSGPGAGVNPGLAGQLGNTMAVLRAAYEVHPSDDLLRLILDLEDG